MCLCISTFIGASAWGNDIARQFNADRFQSLVVGNATTYVLRIDARRALSLGLATVYVSPAQGKLALHSSLDIANKLAEKGWHVDVVTPHWLVNMDTQADTQNDPASDDANIDTVMAWQSQLQTDLEFEPLKQQLGILQPSLESQAQDIVGFRLLIAEGVIAALLLSTAQDSEDNLPNAAALISPFWPEASINQSLVALSGKYPRPLLDMAFAASSRFANQHLQARFDAANVEVKLNYRQRLLPRTHKTLVIAQVSSEIVGWTRSLGW